MALVWRAYSMTTREQVGGDLPLTSNGQFTVSSRGDDHSDFDISISALTGLPASWDKVFVGYKLLIALINDENDDVLFCGPLLSPNPDADKKIAGLKIGSLWDLLYHRRLIPIEYFDPGVKTVSLKKDGGRTFTGHPGKVICDIISRYSELTFWRAPTGLPTGSYSYSFVWADKERASEAIKKIMEDPEGVEVRPKWYLETVGSKKLMTLTLNVPTASRLTSSKPDGARHLRRFSLAGGLAPINDAGDTESLSYQDSSDEIVNRIFTTSPSPNPESITWYRFEDKTSGEIYLDDVLTFDSPQTEADLRRYVDPRIADGKRALRKWSFNTAGRPTDVRIVGDDLEFYGGQGELLGFNSAARIAEVTTDIMSGVMELTLTDPRIVPPELPSGLDQAIDERNEETGITPGGGTGGLPVDPTPTPDPGGGDYDMGTPDYGSGGDDGNKPPSTFPDVIASSVSAYNMSSDGYGRLIQDSRNNLYEVPSWNVHYKYPQGHGDSLLLDEGAAFDVRSEYENPRPDSDATTTPGSDYKAHVISHPDVNGLEPAFDKESVTTSFALNREFINTLVQAAEWSVPIWRDTRMVSISTNNSIFDTDIPINRATVNLVTSATPYWIVNKENSTDATMYFMVMVSCVTHPNDDATLWQRQRSWVLCEQDIINGVVQGTPRPINSFADSRFGLDEGLNGTDSIARKDFIYSPTMNHASATYKGVTYWHIAGKIFCVFQQFGQWRVSTVKAPQGELMTVLDYMQKDYNGAQSAISDVDAIAVGQVSSFSGEESSGLFCVRVDTSSTDQQKRWSLMSLNLSKDTGRPLAGADWTEISNLTTYFEDSIATRVRPVGLSTLFGRVVVSFLMIDRPSDEGKNVGFATTIDPGDKTGLRFFALTGEGKLQNLGYMSASTTNGPLVVGDGQYLAVIASFANYLYLPALYTDVDPEKSGVYVRAIEFRQKATTPPPVDGSQITYNPSVGDDMHAGDGSSVSYNDWGASENVDDFGGLENREIGGSKLLAPGQRSGLVSAVQYYVAEQLHKRVEQGVEGKCGGYNFRRNVNNPDEWSCHASGTAFDWNSDKHPNGAEGTFTADQIAEIRKIQDEVTLDGKRLVRWGGDFSSTKDEMHFEVVGTADELQRLVDKLKGVVV